MRIGIDYTTAVVGRGGIARCVRELVAQVVEMDHVNEYVLTVTRDAKRHLPAALPHKATIRALPFSERMAATIWHRLGVPLPLECFAGQLDVFHGPDFFLPPLRGATGVVTIYDLSPLIYPEWTDPKVATYFEKAVKSTLQRARTVVAVSNRTKGDLIQLLGIEEDKIEVIHIGVSEIFTPIEDERVLSDVRRRYSIHRPFILSLGTIQPRKNLQRLVAAYCMIREDPKITHQLLLVGGERWLSEDLFQQIETLNVNCDIVFLGYVPDEDLPPLMSLADVLAFPSLYEGFGLPPVEAMACATPVVSSNASAMPEILGDAALLVDPLDIPALAAALRRSLLDHELRAQLVERGLERCRRFTWRNAAKRYLEVYEKAQSTV